MLTGGGVVWGEKKILNHQKPDLHGGKRANDMIIKQHT
uniref:Uncharacterized protein n=1 Tax=Escherichia coli TaxID=562 RepID=A0A2R4A8Z7_ECOLX|nr:hypothetical protein [Escherichia coli]QTG67489.1 hypothetical protein [Escherichia coli]